MAFCRPCVKSLADLLTSYDGKKISYDEIGNPTSYYNGSRYSFTWQQGRQLATAVKGSTSVSYAYDMAGVRSSKTVGSTTYNYVTLSGLVMRQKWNGSAIEFIYDENNQPFAMRYKSQINGVYTTYYYALNVQGDVIALLNSSGSVVAKYSYDPWGKVTVQNPNGTANTSSTFVGNINPLRYKGYYYDTETGFYYLQSRYYDPAIGRFINADAFATTDVLGLLSTNMFAYCENNPISRFDPTGELFWDVLDGFMAAMSWEEFISAPSWENFGWAFADTIALLPGIPSASYVRRGADAVDALSHSTHIISGTKKASTAGWKVGDDISNLTKAGNVPQWSTVRQRYWKNEAFYNANHYSDENILIMKKGRAPMVEYKNTGEFYPMELHHPYGRAGDNLFDFFPVTPWEHAEIDEFRYFRP